MRRGERDGKAGGGDEGLGEGVGERQCQNPELSGLLPQPVELAVIPSSPLLIQVAPLLAAEDQRMLRFTGGTCGLAYNRKVMCGDCGHVLLVLPSFPHMQVWVGGAGLQPKAGLCTAGLGTEGQGGPSGDRCSGSKGHIVAAAAAAELLCVRPPPLHAGDAAGPGAASERSQSRLALGFQAGKGGREGREGPSA